MKTGLTTEGIDTVEQLEKVNDTKLLRIRNFGRKSLNEVKCKLAEMAEYIPIVCTKAEVVKEFADKVTSRIYENINYHFDTAYYDGLSRGYPDSELSRHYQSAFEKCKSLAKEAIVELAEQYGKEER